MRPKVQYVVGIDEAGRGPLAGPLAMGGVLIPIEAAWFRKFSRGVRDSKQLSPDEREAWYKKIFQFQKEGKLHFSVTFINSKTIDKRGLSFALHDAVRRTLKKLGAVPEVTTVLLDGSLCAPKEFIFQRTIIRGDESEPVISLASIVAKVLRDRKMTALAKKFPEYGLDVHKGYGTKKHRDAIKLHGLSPLHRKSFCGAFIANS